MTVGEMFSRISAKVKRRKEIFEEFRIVAGLKGKFLINALSWSLAAGFFTYCVCLGIRLGLAL